MSSKKPNPSLSQKIITLLLVLKVMFVGIEADSRIQQGDSPIEVLIWMINHCITVLQKVEKLEDKNKLENQDKEDKPY
jgi:hypothetical protein